MHRMLINLLALAGLLPTVAWGLTTDKDQPIYLEADRVKVDDNAGLATYRGHVKLTQGSLQLWGDTVVVHSTDGETEKIVVMGKPARFRQQPDGDKQLVRGEGKRLEYFAQEERLKVLDGARLWQGKDEFKSERIEMDTARDVVTAGATDKEPGRIHMTIQPRHGNKPRASASP